MNAKSEFRRYIEENEALPPDCLLGYIVWFTIGDDSYDVSKMEAEFTRLNLNPGFLPKGINPADAFEKATKGVQGTKYPVSDGVQTLTAELMVREVDRTPHQIIRHLVREVKDSANRRLLYGPVGEFVFYRPVAKNHTVDHSSYRERASLATGVSDSERPVLEAALAKYREAFTRYAQFADGQRIRALVRDYLLFLNGFQMKPSVYFVHNSRVPDLMALQEFVNGLGNASMSLLPMVDLPRSRAEVNDSFQREAEKELANLVADVQKLQATRKGPIRPAAVMKVREEYDRVMRKISEYSRLLKLSQDRTAGAAEAALDSVIALQTALVKELES